MARYRLSIFDLSEGRTASHQSQVTEYLDGFFAVGKGCIPAAPVSGGPILQIRLAVDNGAIAFNAIKIFVNDLTVRVGISCQEISNKLSV
jgi:hypothetical protein